MSDHGHAGAHTGAAETHGGHHHDYLGTPADEPGPGEPVTPGWLTLLGISLVLCVMLAFLATRADGKTRAELTPAGAATAPPAAATVTVRPARPLPSGIRPGMLPSAFLPRPGMSGMPRPLRPPGQFAVQPGNTGGDAARPSPAVPQ